MPSILTTAQPMPFSARMNGLKTRRKSSVGFATMSDVCSGYCSAMVLGASSPSTMWSAVMMLKAIANAIVWEVATEIGVGRWRSSGSSIDASAGSPIQPSPRLAIVMPSWVAAMNWSGLSSARLTGRAMRLPSASS